MKRDENTSSLNIHHSAFALIVIGGALLRPFPIWFGLPYGRARPDEETSIGLAVAVLGGDPNPHFFHWPSLTFYLFAGLFQIASLIRGLVLDSHLTDTHRLLIARGCVALVGTATIAVLFRIGRRIAGDAVRLIAALFLAVSILHVRESHFAMTDALMTFFAMLSLALLLRAFDRQRQPSLGERTVPASQGVAAAGLAAGLAASTKYTAVALLVPALTAVCLREPPVAPGPPRRGLLLALAGLFLAAGVALALGGAEPLAARLHLKDARLLHPEHALGFVRGVERSLIAGGAALALLTLLAPRVRWAGRVAREDVAIVLIAAAAGFLIGTPYALLDPQAFLSDLAFNHQTRFEYKGLVGASTSYLAYVRLLGDALTGPFLVAAGAGALVAVGRALAGDAAAAVLFTALLAPFLLVASSGHQAMRFLAPALPAAAWLAAMGLSALPSTAARRAGAGLVLARAALGSVLVVRLFFVDSRLVAQRWIEANVPAGATVDLIANNPGYAPSLPPGRNLRIVPTLSREMAPADRFVEAAARYPAEASPWLILTASYYERFLEHPEQAPERAAFFRDLLEGGGGFDVVARFRQQGWLRPPVEFVDPEIVILRKKQ